MLKKKRYRFPLLMLLTTVWLTGCALSVPSPRELLADAKQEIELFRAEYGEIREFFDRKRVFSDAPGVMAAEVVPDPAIRPMLKQLRHTEILESAYNSLSDAATIRSLILDSEDGSVTGSVTDLAEPETEQLTPDQTYGYVAVPRFADVHTSAVRDVLDKAGIPSDMETRVNPSPAGDVFAIRFAGVSDGETYYINPDVPVTLFVSARKQAETTAERAENIVYLTYDDGPTADGTDRLLDILDAYGVKAAFFTTGEAIEKYPASARLIAERGHVLGCHTVSHVYDSIYASPDALSQEIDGWEEIVSAAGIDLSSHLFRFPGGSVGSYLDDGKSEAMTAMLESRGYTVFDWNVVTNDAVLFMAPEGTNTYDYLKENFISTLEACLSENAQKTNAPIVILMHETVPETIDLMPWMLEYLINRGFRFGSLADFGSSWTFADR